MPSNIGLKIHRNGTVEYSMRFIAICHYFISPNESLPLDTNKITVIIGRG